MAAAWLRDRGLVVSASAHVLLLGLTLVAFSKTPPFEEATESVPVEIVTASQLNQIMKGEKTAKVLKPTPKVDKVADIVEAKPLPPTPEAKKDVPTPPPPLKRLADPGEDDKPEQKEPQKVAALPPPRPVPEPPKIEPKPEPPARPQPVKAAIEEKPEPEEAEVVRPKPVERPKDLPKEAAKEPAKEPPKPVPTPAPKPSPQLKVDEVAKLLEKNKPDPKLKPDAKADKPASKPKSGDETQEPKPSLDLSAISKLLDHDKPQRRAATGAVLQQTASLGSPTASAARMSPSMWAGLDNWMQDRYRSCWSYLGISRGEKYVPQVRVRFAADGTLAAEPALVNPPGDPALRGLADSAMRAVRKCNPMQIPAQYMPYYEQWKARVVRFDPDEMT